MRDRPVTDRVVVEIGRRGRLVTGEPFFEPGVPLTIDRRGLGDAAPGDLAVVRTSRGRARVESVLGPSDRIDSVIDALLHARDELGAHEAYATPPFTTAGRADLRGLPTVTIDPETAKDFDDAISAVPDGDATRVYVHIADVAHFVPAGSPLDEGAADRALSVYVPGRVAPMLPPALADDACSLRPYEDRLALTVELALRDGMPIADPSFYRSVIRSDARLAYGEAEGILAGRQPAVPEAAETLERVAAVADVLRTRRFARGALRVESPEVVFAFDGDGGVERAWLEAEPHAHALVEELMILANEAVAQFLASRRTDALFRVHEPPEAQSIARLVATLAELEVPTPPLPDADHLSPGDAAQVMAEIADRVVEYVRTSGRGAFALPPLVLRALKQARYDPANLGHSGLASPAYCHFTSPIRRYPDLVCHRALLRELGVEDDVPPDGLAALAEHASTRERDAADVEYAADAICLAWLLERVLFERGWDRPFEGEIVGVIASGLFVRFDDLFEGYVPVRTLADDYYEITELGTSLVGRRGGRQFRLADRLDVRVERIERAQGKVELRAAAVRTA